MLFKSIKLNLLFRILIPAFLFLLQPGFATAQKSTTKKPVASNPSGPSVENEMRRLWSENVMWTHMYLVSEMADLADKASILNQLRKTQKQIAKTVKSLHPSIDEAAFTALLDSSILGVTALIFNANKGQANDIYQVKESLMKQADQMAVQLNTANPGMFPLAEMKNLFQSYVNETHNEIMARSTKNWDSDISSYERVQSIALKIGEVMVKGMASSQPAPAQQPAPKKK